MWFSGLFFFILSLTIEVFLRWKLLISPFFVSGKLGSLSNTYLPHCIYRDWDVYIYIYSPVTKTSPHSDLIIIQSVWNYMKKSTRNVATSPKCFKKSTCKAPWKTMHNLGQTFFQTQRVVTPNIDLYTCDKTKKMIKSKVISCFHINWQCFYFSSITQFFFLIYHPLSFSSSWPMRHCTIPSMSKAFTSSWIRDLLIADTYSSSTRHSSS